MAVTTASIHAAMHLALRLLRSRTQIFSLSSTRHACSALLSILEKLIDLTSLSARRTSGWWRLGIPTCNIRVKWLLHLAWQG
jgi:hypothetical protein